VRLCDSAFFFRTHENIADTLAQRAVFVAVISGGVTKGTIFPVAAVGGAGVGAIAAFAVDRFAATAVGDSTALGAVRHRKVSFQHVGMIRPRSRVSLFKSEQRTVL
jgi:hypothetical protein